MSRLRRSDDYTSRLRASHNFRDRVTSLVEWAPTLCPGSSEEEENAPGRRLHEGAIEKPLVAIAVAGLDFDVNPRGRRGCVERLDLEDGARLHLVLHQQTQAARRTV